MSCMPAEPTCSAVTRKRVTLGGSNGGSAAAKTSTMWSTLAMAGSLSSLRRGRTSATMPAPPHSSSRRSADMAGSQIERHSSAQ